MTLITSVAAPVGPESICKSLLWVFLKTLPKNLFGFPQLSPRFLRTAQLNLSCVHGMFIILYYCNSYFSDLSNEIHLSRPKSINPSLLPPYRRFSLLLYTKGENKHNLQQNRMLV